MGRLFKGALLAFLLAVLALSFQVIMFFVVLLGKAFYGFILYPLYIAFYIGLYPLIWIVKRVF